MYNRLPTREMRICHQKGVCWGRGGRTDPTGSNTAEVLALSCLVFIYSCLSWWDFFSVVILCVFVYFLWFCWVLVLDFLVVGFSFSVSPPDNF